MAFKHPIAGEGHPLGRRAAQESGDKRYIPENPCSKCGMFLRYTSSKGCVQCHNEKMKIRAKKPEVIEKRRTEYENKKDHFNNLRKQNDKAIQRATSKIWRDNNKDKLAIYSERNRDSINKSHKAWRLANPERVKIINKIGDQNRRTREKKAGRLSIKRIDHLLEVQMGLCHWCFEPMGEDWEIEHVLALANGGNNADENIVLACRLCNAQKNALFLNDWFAKFNCRSRRK